MRRVAAVFTLGAISWALFGCSDGPFDSDQIHRLVDGLRENLDSGHASAGCSGAWLTRGEIRRRAAESEGKSCGATLPHTLGSVSEVVVSGDSATVTLSRPQAVLKLQQVPMAWSESREDPPLVWRINRIDDRGHSRPH